MGWWIIPLLISSSLARQTITTPAFEVASIKPSDPNPDNPMWIGMRADPGTVQYTNITLKDCIRAAYRVRDFQIQGPPWIGEARFEITAKLPSGAPLDQIPEMLQSLLLERFKLTLRRDSKEQSVYALLAGAGAPQLKPAETSPDAEAPTAVGPDGQPRPPMMFGRAESGVRLMAKSTTLASFVELMSRFTSRPVVDLTGIKGRFDIELTFAPEITPAVLAANRPIPETSNTPSDTPSDPAPSIFDAVKRLGLRLESRKAPMELLTVTNIERMPTPN
jgi:uncharacterized protein (TIGR03435 family)